MIYWSNMQDYQDLQSWYGLHFDIDYRKYFSSDAPHKDVFYEYLLSNKNVLSEYYCSETCAPGYANNLLMLFNFVCDKRKSYIEVILLSDIYRKHSVDYWFNFSSQLREMKFMQFRAGMSVSIVLLILELHVFITSNS